MVWALITRLCLGMNLNDDFQTESQNQPVVLLVSPIKVTVRPGREEELLLNLMAFVALRELSRTPNCILTLTSVS